jgi:hypothetical protein
MIPSKKKLMESFGEPGKIVRQLLEKRSKTRDFESVVAWENGLYHKSTYQERLEIALNEILDGFGVEAIWSDKSELEPRAIYINMGDTYNITLLYDCHSERWLITTYGDFIEAKERQGEMFL